MFQGDKKSGDSPRPSGINGIEKSNLKKDKNNLRSKTFKIRMQDT